MTHRGLPAYLSKSDLASFDRDLDGVAVVHHDIGGRVATVYRLGKHNRPVVVVLPPYGMSYLLVSRLAKRLSQHYRVLSWESAGCPDPQPGEGPVTLSQAAEAMLKILDREGVDEPHFVSWCQAAQIAVHAIASLDFQPSSMSWIAPAGLCAPTVQSEFDRCALPVYLEIQRLGASQAAKLGAILNRYRGEPLSGDHLGEKLTMLHLSDGDLTHLFSCYIRQYVDSIPAVEAALPDVLHRRKSLILHCKDDTFSHYSGSVRLRRRFPSVRLDLVDEGGHLQLFNAPDDVASKIMDFIDETESVRSQPLARLM